MRFYFMLERRAGPPSPVLAELVHILQDHGHVVETGIAEDLLQRPEQLTTGYDLVLVKSHSQLSLSLAGIMHEQRVPLLNPYAASAAIQDKILTAYQLRAAGIPAPRSWVTGEPGTLRFLLEQHPLIVKPFNGYGGAGIHVIRQQEDLKALPAFEQPVLVQEYMEGGREDLKVYVVGERVFAVKKSFSAHSHTQAGVPVSTTPPVADMALACGQVFGLALYGLDIVETAHGPMVVDVNYFPGYKGVPNIAPLLARFIEDYARGRETLETPRQEGRVESEASMDGRGLGLPPVTGGSVPATPARSELHR